jgi:hypothetical protein
MRMNWEIQPLPVRYPSLAISGDRLLTGTCISEIFLVWEGRGMGIYRCSTWRMRYMQH